MSHTLRIMSSGLQELVHQRAKKRTALCLSSSLSCFEDSEPLVGRKNVGSDGSFHAGICTMFGVTDTKSLEVHCLASCFPLVFYLVASLS